MGVGATQCPPSGHTPDRHILSVIVKYFKLTASPVIMCSSLMGQSMDTPWQPCLRALGIFEATDQWATSC